MPQATPHDDSSRQPHFPPLLGMQWAASKVVMMRQSGARGVSSTLNMIARCRQGEGQGMSICNSRWNTLISPPDRELSYQ